MAEKFHLILSMMNGYEYDGNVGAVDALLEFFEVCFHSILFFRNVYPPNIFILKKKYNLPVHISLYPDLNQYISGVLKSIKKFLLSNHLKELSLWIFDTIGQPIEKFSFDNFHFNMIECERMTYSQLREIEECFRAYCLKLTTLDAMLPPLPNNTTFKIFIKTNDGSNYMDLWNDSVFEGFPWIAEENPGNSLHNILPMRTLSTPSFNFEMYIEK